MFRTTQNAYISELRAILDSVEIGISLRSLENSAYDLLLGALERLIKKLVTCIGLPIYIAVKDSEVRIIISSAMIKKASPTDLKSISNSFIEELPEAFHRANLWRFQKDDGFVFSYLENDLEMCYKCLTFYPVPNHLAIGEFDLPAAPEECKIEKRLIPKWLTSVGKSKTVKLIPPGRFLSDNLAKELALELISDTLLAQNLKKTTEEIPHQKELALDIATRLQAISKVIGDEPIYLSVVGNQIRITTTPKGMENTSDLLYTTSKESIRFIEDMPEMYRQFNLQETDESGWWGVNNKFFLTFIHLGLD